MLAEGRLVNLGCATVSSFVIELFLGQILAQLDLWKNKDTWVGVYVPEQELDEEKWPASIYEDRRQANHAVTAK